MNSDYRPAEILRKHIIAFSSYILNNIRPNADLEKCRNRIYKDIIELDRERLNLQCFLDSGSRSFETLEFFKETLGNIKESILRANSMTDLSFIKENIENDNYYFTRVNEELIYLGRWNFNLYGRKHINPTVDEAQEITILKENTLRKIMQSIDYGDKEEIVLFSPQCGSGFNEEKLSEYCPVSVTTCGLDIDSYGASEAKKRLDRVIKGTLKGSTISNDCFDIVFLNPRITMKAHYKIDGRLAESNETYLLKNSMRYLKTNGVFVMPIQYYSLTTEMMLFLSKWLKNIKFIKVKEYDEYNQTCNTKIVLMGQKEFNCNYSDVFSDLYGSNFEFLEEPEFGEYVLNTKKDIDLRLFKGSILDESELDAIIKDDNLYEEFFKTVEIKDTLKDTTPLLPFNIGQIGLILSSGCLDGIVEENENTKHVIKGMTIKEANTTTERTINKQGEIIANATETVSNRVQISAFGADGEFYTLV